MYGTKSNNALLTSPILAAFVVVVPPEANEVIYKEFIDIPVEVIVNIGFPAIFIVIVPPLILILSLFASFKYTVVPREDIFN